MNVLIRVQNLLLSKSQILLSSAFMQEKTCVLVTTTHVCINTEESRI